MKLYTVAYKRFECDSTHYVCTLANNKVEAYDKTVYETLTEFPYSAWVVGITYKNGNYKAFNTHEGMPY